MDKIGKLNFWDYLIWFGIILILGWAVLKAFNLIQSPIWVEMIPYFGVGTAGIGGAYKLGKIMGGIEETNKKVDELLLIKDKFSEVEKTHNLCIDGQLSGSPYAKHHKN